MKLKYRPMAIMGFSSLSVLFICVRFSDKFSFVAMGIGILLLLLTVIFKAFRKSIVPFFLSAALILSGASFEVLSDYKISYADSLAEREANITATVLDEPEFSGTRYYYIVKTQSIDGESFEVKLRLSSSNYLWAEPYDKISAKVTLYEIGNASRDLKLYYQSKGIFLGGYLNNYDEEPVTVIKSEKKSADYYFLMLRKTIEGRVLDRLPNNYGGVVVGMLTGNKAYISDETYADIKAAGVAPVFAVSGMHLSVWVLGLYNLLELLKVKKRLNSVIGIAFIILFMGITGFTPSVCRAGIMLITVLVGNLFYRRADSVNSLGFATLLLCIFNPMIVADIGFLLSFSSTLGIILLNPVFVKFLNKILPKGFGLIKAIAEAVFVSVSATIGSIGFVIVFIGYISIYSVLSNLLISYAASLCMLTGGLSSLLSIFGGVSNGFAACSGSIARYIVYIIAKIADLPFATVDTSGIAWAIGVMFAYAMAASLYILRGKGIFFKIFSCIVALSVAVCTTMYCFGFFDYSVVTVLETEGSVNLVIREAGHSAVILSNNKYKYLASNASNILNNKRADIALADTYFGGYQSVYLTLKEIAPKSVIVPRCEQSLTAICDRDKIAVAEDAEIRLWDSTTASFVSGQDLCAFSCELQGVTITALLREAYGEEIPEEYLSGDILICTAVPEGANFNKIIICGEAEDSGISTDKYGEISIKIKNDKFKITADAD